MVWSNMMFNRDFPKLQEHPAFPWKKQSAFTEWTSKVVTYANGIHSVVGAYVAHCLSSAEDHFNNKKRAPPGTVLSSWNEVDPKLVAACLESLPERISGDCYRTGKCTTFHSSAVQFVHID